MVSFHLQLADIALLQWDEAMFSTKHAPCMNAIMTTRGMRICHATPTALVATPTDTWSTKCRVCIRPLDLPWQKP